jgi:NAD(P)H-hydrate epimerase
MKNTTGNEGLAKAGSGDTLAGIIAGVYAQLIKQDARSDLRQKAFLAACLGVYLHGAAADGAIKKIAKHSLTATDVAEALPETLRTLL